MLADLASSSSSTVDEGLLIDPRAWHTPAPAWANAGRASLGDAINEHNRAIGAALLEDERRNDGDD